MKKFVLIALLFAVTLSVAQEKKSKYPQDINKNHELKINAFSLIALSSLDITYERLLNSDSSYGVDIYYNFNDNEDIGFPRKFSLTPFYRWFFSEKYATRGFFVEAFGMLNTQEDENYDYYYDDQGYWVDNSKDLTVTDFALGISVGGKFITKKGFIAEIYLGIGRNLFNPNTDLIDTNIVTRGGISLGYRF